MNFLGVCKRNVGEVKEKWRGMVSNAKKEQNQLSVERKKTGGGIEPASPKRETRRIIKSFLAKTHLSPEFQRELNPVG